MRSFPAYDINPNPKGTGLTLNIDEHNNLLDFDLVRSVAPFFRIKDKRALEIVHGVKDSLKHWEQLADEFSISRREKSDMAPAFLSTN